MKFSKLTVLAIVALALGACGGKDEGHSAPVAEDAAPEEITALSLDAMTDRYLSGELDPKVN